MTSVTATLFFTVMLAAIELGTCLNCYHCNSQQNPDCKDPFAVADKKYLIDCSKQESKNFNQNFLWTLFPGLQDGGVSGATRMCHKLVIESGTVFRTCLDAVTSNPNHTCTLLEEMANKNKIGPIEPGRTLKYCSVCNKEGCNAAGSIAASLTLAGVTALVAILGYRH